MTKIEQNFEVNSQGEIVFKGRVLPVKAEIADYYKPPQIRENAKILPNQKRWLKGSFLTSQQDIDEEYQKKSKIA